MPPGFTLTITIIVGLIGASIGSFLNVCIDRLPAGGSLLYPASHCDGCQRQLSGIDLIPVLSFLWLRGKCRYCQMKIPSRVFWVELGTGLLLAFLYYSYGWGIKFVLLSFYCCLFIVIMVIDLEQGLILNIIVYPALVAAFVINIFFSQPTIINGLLGGAIGFAFLALPALVYRGGMGWGDVKMAALIGLVVGFPNVFAALLIAIVLGGLVAGVLLISHVKKRKEAIPFGPFLSIASIVTLLWGTNIIHWYLGLLGRV